MRPEHLEIARYLATKSCEFKGVSSKIKMTSHVILDLGDAARWSLAGPRALLVTQEDLESAFKLKDVTVLGVNVF